MFDYYKKGERVPEYLFKEEYKESNIRFDINVLIKKHNLSGLDRYNYYSIYPLTENSIQFISKFFEGNDSNVNFKIKNQATFYSSSSDFSFKKLFLDEMNFIIYE